MSSDSDTTPVPTISPEFHGETKPINITSSTGNAKPSQPDVHRLKLPTEHRDSTISTPDSMKVETGSSSDGIAEAVSPVEGLRAKSHGVAHEAEVNGSDESWEEVRHERTQALEEGTQDNRPVWVGHVEEKNATQEEEGSGDIAPEFRPRTPRPYGSHSE
ncbi:uncharacterized protein EAF01_004087 [Botrytis porri]|uniref:uncharacterized protein n=1 Tax=Botrytis porri TaxID=87229 RepID=UPI0019022FEE|nr:uncharacterized protein EAF01_004087 [Botrytis porri]KAF7908332.1 hypothetical protein EAF01_004087 [Botrytis porri]